MQHGLSSGHLSFLLKAGMDALPTPLNLKCMRIQVNSSCHLCNNHRPTSAHILNNCFVALNQGRYTWRHDSVLAQIAKGLQKHLPPSVKVYADLDNMRADINPPATIPPNVLITSLRPDIVASKEICLLELTVPTPHMVSSL